MSEIAIFSGSFSPLHHGHLSVADWADKNDYELYFELSTKRFDKPDLNQSEVSKITQQFASINRNCMVTDCPSFVEKRKYLIHKFGISRPVTFLIGYDTAERLCDEKYTFGSKTELDRVLKFLCERTKFVVFARNGKDDLSKLHPIFIKSATIATDWQSVDISSTELRTGRASVAYSIDKFSRKLKDMAKKDRFYINGTIYEIIDRSDLGTKTLCMIDEDFMWLDSELEVYKVNYV